MNSRLRFPRCPVSVLSALVAVGALIAPGTAAAESSGVLSPELAQLATPELQSLSPSEQAGALGLPIEGAGSLEREGSDVTVEISFEGDVSGALPALREAGAEVLVASDTYQVVTVSVPPANLPALAQVRGVSSVDVVRQPIFSGIERSDLSGIESPNLSVDAKAACEGGSVLTEGLDQLEIVSQPNTNGAREAFGVRGAGQTIGVLSNSFDDGDTGSKLNVKTRQYETITAPTHAAEDIVTKDLPGPENECSGQQVAVTVLQEGVAPVQGDEGRAMLQIVHDVAPHAKLAFATAAGGEVNMAQNIEKLAAPVSAGGAGATVIIDDVTYPEEPMFQDGPIAAAINKVTAAGVTYVTAAGNNNFEGPANEELGSWEIPAFKDTQKPAFCPIPVGVANRHCLDFEPGSKENPKYEFSIEQGKPVEIAVGWSEPEYGLKADLDLFLLREVPEKEAVIIGETKVVGEARVDNIANGRPAAYVTWTNPEPEPFEPKIKITEKSTEQEKEQAAKEAEEAPPYKSEKLFAVINRCVGTICAQTADPTALPRVKMVFLARLYPNPIDGVKYETSSPADGIVVGPTIFGHAGAPAAITVGATDFATEDGELINTAGTPEVFTSRGPVTHYWAPVNGTTPAAKLGSPEVIEKPNVVASDCVANTFFTNFTFYLGFWRFCGTSAAAPHVAGIAALMKQASPSQSPAGIRTAIGASAKPVTGFGANIVGKGLVRARLAIEALSNRVTVNDPASTPVPPIKPPTPTPPTPEPEPEPGPTPPAPTPPSNPTERSQSASGGGEAKSTPGGEGEKKIRALPTTTIKKHPPKVVKSPVGRPKLSFTFVSDQKGVKFECSVDGGKWTTCAANWKAPFTLGPHEVKVRARGTDNTVDKTPAVWKFKVQLVV